MIRRMRKRIKFMALSILLGRSKAAGFVPQNVLTHYHGEDHHMFCDVHSSRSNAKCDMRSPRGLMDSDTKNIISGSLGSLVRGGRRQINRISKRLVNKRKSPSGARATQELSSSLTDTNNEYKKRDFLWMDRLLVDGLSMNWVSEQDRALYMLMDRLNAKNRFPSLTLTADEILQGLDEHSEQVIDILSDATSQSVQHLQAMLLEEEVEVVESGCASVAEECCIVEPSLSDEEFDAAAANAHNKARDFIESAARDRLTRWSIHTRNLSVRANLCSGFWVKLLTLGEAGSDLRIDFDRLAFPNIKISGGGRVDVNNLKLSVLSVHPTTHNIYPGRRFTNPFEFHAQSCILTQDDIMESCSFRNGLTELLNRIFKRIITFDKHNITVTSVNLLSSKKISCRGAIVSPFGNFIPFEVRSGLKISRNGHVLKLSGLEVAMDPMAQVFMPVVPEIDVHLGEDTTIEHIAINGKRKLITFSIRVKIKPNRKEIKQQQHKDGSKNNDCCGARYQFDVASWLTTLGSFDK